MEKKTNTFTLQLFKHTFCVNKSHCWCHFLLSFLLCDFVLSIFYKLPIEIVLTHVFAFVRSISSASVLERVRWTSFCEGNWKPIPILLQHIYDQFMWYNYIFCDSVIRSLLFRWRSIAWNILEYGFSVNRIFPYIYRSFRKIRVTENPHSRMFCAVCSYYIIVLL